MWQWYLCGAVTPVGSSRELVEPSLEAREELGNDRDRRDSSKALKRRFSQLNGECRSRFGPNRLEPYVRASREPRYPRRVTEPAPPPACPHCSEPMQLATKSIPKRGLKPGQRVERTGDEQRVRIWVCRRCGIQRRAQEQ